MMNRYYRLNGYPGQHEPYSYSRKTKDTAINGGHSRIPASILPVDYFIKKLSLFLITIWRLYLQQI